MADQTPIPDQLFLIRTRIAALQVEEKALRDILIADPTARVGASFIAAVKEVVSYRVRAKDIEKSDPELFAKYAHESVANQVWLIKRSEDDQ